jgi:hypothetical protein
MISRFDTKRGSKTRIAHGPVRTVGLVVLAALLIAAATTAASAATSLSRKATAPGAKRGHATAPRLLARYSLLRRSHAAAALLPSVAAAVQRQDARAPELGLDPGAVQTVSFGQQSVSVQPGASGMCAALNVTVALPGRGNLTITPGHCDTTNGIVSYGLVGAFTAGPDHFAWGVVPNGNSAVTALLASGASQSIPVTNNAFLSEVGTPIVSLTFDTSPGHSVTVPTAPS